MLNDERSVGHFGCPKVWYPGKLFAGLTGKVMVGSSRRDASLVQYRQHPRRLGFNQRQALAIIFEFYLLPVNALGYILGLFKFEDKVDKVLLELLVGVVDAELFEPVY